MYGWDYLVDPRVKPEPPIIVLTEVALFEQEFGCMPDRQTAFFQMMVDNRGEA